MSIKPLDGIEGVRPGAYLYNYRDKITSIFFSKKINITKGDYLDTALLTLDSMRIVFDIYTSRITRVSICNGDSNKIEGTNISIGIKVSELLTYHKSDWDSDEYCLWNVNFPGMFFKFLSGNQAFLMEKIDSYADCALSEIGMIAPDENGDFDIYGIEWYEKKERIRSSWENI
ncbi:hypothetical protein [Fulvivirga sediminis]|uniref:Uncharacterized protein n=1 Tax=Fulvivirga sediminis TaxID=2803949 RepID=A0A937FDT6_9BACT|nr:hypothetical protein [Fulvivirga sediminis]MBL3658924.1 hypothetical protein [Fulvivirga sediminis]